MRIFMGISEIFPKFNKSSRSDESKTITMSDDEVDQDLLEFMRAHMNGSNLPAVEATTGVLESAEYICDVRTLNLHLDPEC